ncbi:MAG: hypothetical protein GXP54_06085 [Deltaproteobacteria bacterium]|nr:hypothetical protein [Deltaproteobacteria bacterium]
MSGAERAGLWAALGLMILMTVTGCGHDGEFVRRIIPRQASEQIGRALKRLPSDLRLQGASFGRDHNDVIICRTTADKQCFSVLLQDPLTGCDGVVAGPWCVTWPKARPDADIIASLKAVLEGMDGTRIWRTLETRRLPLRIGENLEAGWVVKGYSWTYPAGAAILSIRLSGNGRAVKVPIIFPVPPGRRGDCMASTKNYCLLKSSPPDDSALEGHEGAVEALARALVSRDRFEPRPNPRLIYDWALLAMILALALATLWILRDLIRQAPPPFWIWACVAGILCLGFILRLTLSPWAFIHEFFHYSAPFRWLFADVSLPYGDVGPVLYAAVNRTFGGEEKAIFATNAVLSTLTLGAVIALDFALFRRWPRALFAGFVLCLLPQHLRYSSSEVLHVPATLFIVWSVALVILFVDKRNLSTLLAALLALFLATQSRPEGMAAPVMAILAVALTRPGQIPSIVKDRRVLLGALVLIALIVFQFIEFRARVVAGPQLGFRGISGIVWFDSASTPVALWVLWGLGLYWGLTHRIGATLWVVISVALLTGGSLLLFDNPLFNLRSQLLSTPLHAMVAAGAFQIVVDWRTGRTFLRKIAMAAVMIAPMTGVFTHARFVTEMMASQQEWRFIREALPTLPDGPRWQLAGLDMYGSFPVDLIWSSGKLLEPVDLGSVVTGDRKAVSPKHHVIVYLGMSCYFNTFPESQDQMPTGPMRPECMEAARDHVLKPIVTRTLHGRLDPGLFSYGRVDGPFEIGFYLLDGPVDDKGD